MGFRVADKNYFSEMQPQFEKVELNGSITKTGNYIWGGALTLAWKELIANFVK